MLYIKSKILFYRPQNWPIGKGRSAEGILRPAFNFGKGLLFSGTILNDDKRQEYRFQELYEVNIEFPTIGEEAYQLVEPLIKVGMNMNIQTGSRIVGQAELLYYKYSS